uniref:Glomulin, FKBP associated protein [Columba livia] n=1 Tax=Lepeophtheirus salmonis TaxID=72036 RepID=A0A0K2V2M6_LEPSM
MEAKLKKYLDAWDTVGAREMFQKKLDRKEMDEVAWDLISLISTYITDEINTKCPILIATCSDLLEIVVEYGNPKESLIVLLESCESFSDSVCCLNVLPALSKVLFRLPDKAKKSSWLLSFSTLMSHLHSYRPLTSKCLEKSDRLLLENDPEVIKRLKTVESFTEVILNPIMKVLHTDPEIKDEISTFILNIFHKPIIYLNLHVEEEKTFESRALIVSKTLLNHLFELVPNPLSLSGLYKKLMFKLKNVEGKTNFENSRFTEQSMGVVYYLIFGEGINKERLPLVYNNLYIFKTLLPYVTIFLSEVNEMAVFKGLILFNAIVKSLPHRCLKEDNLNFVLHKDFIAALVKVIVYHDLSEYRMLAYNNYNLYYQSFSLENRVTFFKTIIHLSNHSGLIGDVVTKWKDTVLHNLEEDCPLSQYMGDSMRYIIRTVCQLSHGAETDLLEVSDELQSVLNALYALFARDTQNKTEIWDMREELNQCFINPLQDGLIISKEHYKLKLKNEKSSDGPEVSLMVGGRPIPDMSKEEMKNVINSAINTFEMIEFSLSRLKDFINRRNVP